MKLRTQIIKHLEAKGNYDPEVDDFTIDMLIENIEFANTAKEDIKKNGLMVTMLNGNGFETTKENPAFGTYMKCVTNIRELSTKLGIHRNDRLKLKLIEEQTKDDFDKDFSL